MRDRLYRNKRSRVLAPSRVALATQYIYTHSVSCRKKNLSLTRTLLDYYAIIYYLVYYVIQYVIGAVFILVIQETTNH